jgi:hypothetical protein
MIDAPCSDSSTIQSGNLRKPTSWTFTGRASSQLRFRVRLPKRSEPQNETRTSAQVARPNNARIVSSIIESTPFYRGFALPTRRSWVRFIYVPDAAVRHIRTAPRFGPGINRWVRPPSYAVLPIHMVSSMGRNKNLIRINVCMEPDGTTRFQARWDLSNRRSHPVHT